MTTCRLFLIAHGRSGDKGDLVNIGVIARRPEWFAWIRENLSADRVADHLSPMARGPVERFELPNLDALNFLVHGALDGGGALSLRLDAQGKTYAQALFRLPVEVSDEMFEAISDHWHGAIPPDCVLETNPKGGGKR